MVGVLYSRLLEEGYIEQAEHEKHRVEQVHMLHCLLLQVAIIQLVSFRYRDKQEPREKEWGKIGLQHSLGKLKHYQWFTVGPLIRDPLR